MSYQIEISPSALEMLKQIRDRRIRTKIIERIDGLAEEPEKQGKPLTAELAGYRSLRAIGQRYRIIYRLDGEKVVVTVVAVGIRKEGDKKDIYTLAQKLLRARLLDQQPNALTMLQSLKENQLPESSLPTAEEMEDQILEARESWE
ncbi:MAG: type II toxin-antitoxin system mRNA interferase toxin, RelE/StbE family [Acidobacteriota bacterium]|nr:type II toxin-antitoxin system mRNA interferase toxin, RelE/StbE family [Acidobacteriota bacterium]